MDDKRHVARTKKEKGSQKSGVPGEFDVGRKTSTVVFNESDARKMALLARGGPGSDEATL
jgi:hypothetical protein